MAKFDLSRLLRAPVRNWIAAWVFGAACIGVVGLVAASSLKLVANPIFNPAPVLMRTAPMGEVHGTAYVQFGTAKVSLTDFQVYLQNVKTNAKTAAVTTDRLGRYILRHEFNGDYRVCWSSPGWAPGCSSQIVHIANNIGFMLPLRATPFYGLQIAVSGAPIWGRVTLGDGTSPWFYDPFFDVKQDVRVEAKVGATIVASVNTNAMGEFVFPYVPFSFGRIVQITAVAGGGTVNADAQIGQGTPLTLKLRDRRPSIAALVARLGGLPRHEVPADAKLSVFADVHDPDDDKLDIIWKTAPAEGDIAPQGGVNTIWKLPGRPGIMVLYALANDGHGGISSASVSVSAGTDSTAFGVHLVDQTTGKTVIKADVSANGAAATLSSGGLYVAKTNAATDRFVVNVNAPGYIFVSRIYDHGGVYHEIKLAPASRTVVKDPKGEITLVDQRDPQTLRESGYVETAAATIRIRPGTLVGPDKKPPTKALDGQIAALDISGEQFPGDNGAMVSGKEQGLFSFGAIDVQIRDQAGNRMQLADGQTADVVIPVSDKMPGARPGTIPLWYYNEHTGYWEKLPTPATYDPAVRAYRGTVPHLSAYNIDLNQPDLVCFRVLLDNVQTGQLKASVHSISGEAFPDAGPFPIYDTLNVIKRLPPHSVVQVTITDNGNTAVPGLAIFDQSETKVGTTGSVGTATQAQLTTGGATTPIYPDLPYTNCETISVRFVPSIANPSTTVGTVDFLQAYASVGDDPTTIDYYTHVDPAMTRSGAAYTGGHHATLGDWWNYAGYTETHTGKPNSAPDEAHEAYLNFNDLGFGRDMHIRKNTDGTVYGFVSNYANSAVPDQNPLNAGYAQAQDQTKIIATVVMEATDYLNSPGPSPLHRVVKFFVYAGASAGSPLVDSADLDGFGQKFVPQLCQVCHGGKPFFAGATHTSLDYALRTNNAQTPNPGDAPVAGTVGAVFREFDLATYIYPGDTAPGLYSALLDSDKEEFYNLNQLVVASGTNTVMSDLIAGINPAVHTFDPSWVPSGWAAPSQDLYHSVVAKSCRTCHIAFDQTAVGTTYNWQDYPTFATAGGDGTLDFAVCGSSRQMPHALMTYRNFWLGGLGGNYGPQVLRTYTDAAQGWSSAIGTCQ